MELTHRSCDSLSHFDIHHPPTHSPTGTTFLQNTTARNQAQLLPDLLTTFSMTKTQGRPRRSLRIRLKNGRFASANEASTSTPASTSTNKADLPLTAAATTTAITPSDPTLENKMRVATVTETSDETHTLEEDASLPATNGTTSTAITAVALESDTQIPTARKTKKLTQSHTLEDNALVPTSTLTNATAITTVALATAITTPGTPFDLSTSLSRLPLELRVYVYIDVSINEATWIGNTPITMGYKDVIIEKPTMPKPATFIKTSSSIMLASSEVRDEFRTAVWRDLLNSDRPVTLKLYDLILAPLSDFFASCSPSELQKLVAKGKRHVDIHLTGVFWQKHKKPEDGGSGSIHEVVMAWLSFCGRIGLDATYSYADSSAWPAMTLVHVDLTGEVSLRDFPSPNDPPLSSEESHISRIIEVMRDAGHQSHNERFLASYPISMD
jgi:hypothetical protein